MAKKRVTPFSILPYGSFSATGYLRSARTVSLELSVSYPTDRSLQRAAASELTPDCMTLSVSYPTDRSLQLGAGREPRR